MFCKSCKKSTIQSELGMTIIVNNILLDLYTCLTCNNTNRKIRTDTILKFIQELNHLT